MNQPYPEMGLPPAVDPDAVRIVALGGLGEIGRNMAVLEHRGSLLIIDCGVLFPEDHQPGVDVILPDFSYIENRLDEVAAIILTHGHEDHIGAVPYLLRMRQDIPLIGSQLTLALIEAKLAEHRIKPYTMSVGDGQVEQIGPFSVEFIAVNHSIPDAMALHINTSAGRILHTGDFKMDQLPLDGRITDLRAFARAGDLGVDLFMVDSTNAEVPGFTTHERDIAPVLDRVFQEAKQRVIVASFASHVHRVQQVLDTSYAHGRKVVLIGRSMVRNMGIASKMGYLNVPQDTLIDMRQMNDYPDDQIVLMCTGSQGEPMAALSRMANKEHKVSIGAGDTVILASSQIPGNEMSISRVINGLTRLGSHVVHQGNAKVHVSGHASAGELLYCYNIVQPKNVLPVHGEVRHMNANAAIAASSGVPWENILQAEDGHVIDLFAGEAKIVGSVPCGLVYVDGATIGEVTDSDLKDRRILAEEGFISIFVAVELDTGQVVVGPEIHARGLAEDDAIFDTIRPAIIDAIADAADRDVKDTHQLQQVVRRVVGRWAGSKLRRRPMLVPVVVGV